jgi:DNA-binding MarR family transcriptional regulator
MAQASQPSRELDARAAFFKALGHPTRLLMLNLIERQPRHTEELAEILSISPGTASHHLGLLGRAGLLRGERDQYYQVYHLSGEALGRRLGDLVRLTKPALAQGGSQDAWRERVLETFLVQGRLRVIPAQRKKRRVVLERLAEDFEPDRDYPEPELNRILVDYHDDVATLRREMVAEQLLERSGGIYRRL